MKQDREAHASSAAASPQRSKNPHDKSGYGTEPYSIYLYYIGPSGTKDDSKWFFYQTKARKIPPFMMKRIVADLVENAIEQNESPPPCPPNYNWRKKSYLAIVVDNDKWEFEPNPTLHFKTNNGGIDNHTFYDADLDSITIFTNSEKERELKLFYCINHVRSATDEKDLEKDTSHWFEFAIHSKGRPIGPYTGDGTNLGPPVPPPPTGSGGFLKWLKEIVSRVKSFLGH